MDPGSALEKMDPDPGYFYKFTEFFQQSKFLKFFVLFFSLIFMLKLDEPFRNQGIFYNLSLVFKLFNFGFRELTVDPHILRIRIQEANGS